jgi:hypothetical protein
MMRRAPRLTTRWAARLTLAFLSAACSERVVAVDPGGDTSSVRKIITQVVFWAQQPELLPITVDFDGVTVGTITQEPIAAPMAAPISATQAATIV